MPQVQEHPEHPEGGRKYGGYQMEIYADGLLRNKLPTVTPDPNKLEEQAKHHLGARSYNYVAGGAGERATMDANRLAFRQWKMIPRMLRQTTHRDLTVNIFGEKHASPLFIAPVGVQTIFHQDKETGVAEMATEIGVPYILSTASSSSIEDVAKASGDGKRWFQLYWPQDDEITRSLLRRAKSNGFKVLVVTLDTWALSWRPLDLENAYVPFASGIGDQTGFSDPVFRRKFNEKHNKEVEDDIFLASREWEADVFSGSAHTWDQLKLLKQEWDGPIVLKGIQHVDDAKMAVEAGVQGIVVSNHGGRQLDGAIGSLEVLPEIVDAVGDAITVLFDSGIRTGVDVMKALCLGAKGVLIGRPFVYGLAIAGKQGARDAVRGILADLDQSMGLAGVSNIAGCNRSMVRRVQYGGDVYSSRTPRGHRMPHQVSPPMAPAVVSKTPSSIPPTPEEISSLLDTVFTAKTSQGSLDGAYALTNLLINSVGFRGFRKYSILDVIRKAAADKKDGAKRESAMIVLGALFEKFPPAQPISEVIFLLQDGGILAPALDALADKGAVVRESAQYAIDALYSNLLPESLVVGLLPALSRYLGKRSGKWQGTVAAIELLGRMADKAKLGMGSKEEEKAKEVLRESMGNRLASLIPIVEAGMHDLKSEVAKQATKTMASLTTLLSNDDVAPRIPLLIKTMQNPSTDTLQKAIHALSQTTFVAIVTSPVLALLTPLLERSLNTPTTSQEVLRQTVVVVENLTKLVHDPLEARTFLPKLKPGVQGVKDRASLPEVRELATRAVNVINHAMGEDDGNLMNGQISPTSREDVVKCLEKEVRLRGGITSEPGDAELWTITKDYISEMAREDINHREIQRVSPCIEPYLQYLVKDDQAQMVADALKEHYVDEDRRKFGQPIKEDIGEVEIVNTDFSLAYGGMLLLSHTNLRLLKGHRYGLCGRNGAGKSTLMRSIAEGKLEGFPSKDELRTCFVEHNQGEDADLSIIEFVAKDPELAAAGRQRVSEVLSEVGFTAGPDGRQSQQVGSLSGGWKMKLALARAMLMGADVLLLDEPTNHLDVSNVKWLQEYLKSHTEITSLIVSHDSGFLDEVCTDIYHYEAKKLVCYPGNLADFVRVKPEGKSYYTLSASQVQFKFPNPGLLTGVKSNTRAIIRMSNCTFTYPGASKPSLADVSCALTLSSRTAIIGANGAGKSTLIKLLTGETIPQTGKVEKHPNLRIGYIKQHALEHVEMHMEKTPNQYLQWRYANGDDREVLMKQTRVLTPEDKAQMDKFVDLGDGKGGRRIENLMGRQKYKKSFQYEVKWVGMLPKHNSQISRETLLELGFDKLVQEFDDHEASREGLGFRELQPKVISKHFEDIGLDPDIANHNEISGLSGGQKVKVVLAGAMWNNPHLLVLDEPTNYLDRDSLGGLAVAIRDYKGGVVMISHNEEFVGALCPEQWYVADGRVTHKGHLAVAMDRFEDSRPGSSAASSAVSSAMSSAQASAVNSEAEGGDMKFKAKKKKKMTRAQQKEREVRRRLRHIEWLNSPKGTPHPKDSDDEE